MNERALRGLEQAFGAPNVALARLGASEIPLVAPADEAGFVEALALARRDKLVAVPTGLGSKLAWTRAPARADFLLSTRAHSGVVAYEPGDGTLTARAGSTLAELAARAATGGNALTPDVPRPQSATLGGVIGAAQSGADRLRYGPVRDHVLGVRVVLGDGTLAQSGGRLVKNVTGYDLQRLFTGSHGTLCVILEASLRLFALPERECLFEIEAQDRAQMLQLCAAAQGAPLRPISLSAARLGALRSSREWLVQARLGGRHEVVADERAVLATLWPAARVFEGPVWPEDAHSLRDASFTAHDGPLLHVECGPTAFARALALVEGALAAEEVAPGAAGATRELRWLCEPGLATLDVALQRAGDPGQLARTLSSLRTALAPLGGRARLRHAPPDLGVDPFGAPPAGLALMQRIRARLDPDGVFDSGRILEPR